MDNFGRYASLYDTIYQAKDYSGEVACIQEYFRDHNTPVDDVLEFGCGTGRHAVELGNRGYKVVGIDKSPTMINVANASIPDHLRSRLTLLEGDARSARFARTFDAVIALFHVVSYQVQDEDILKLFGNAARHLRTGGIFVFDFWYGPAVLNLLPEEREASFEDSEYHVERNSSPSFRDKENVVDVTYEINLKKKKSGEEGRFSERHSMRYFFLPELRAFLTESGFAILSVEDEVSGKNLTPKTWSGRLCAKKIRS